MYQATDWNDAETKIFKKLNRLIGKGVKKGGTPSSYYINHPKHIVLKMHSVYHDSYEKNIFGAAFSLACQALSWFEEWLSQ